MSSYNSTPNLEGRYYYYEAYFYKHECTADDICSTQQGFLNCTNELPRFHIKSRVFTVKELKDLLQETIISS